MTGNLKSWFSGEGISFLKKNNQYLVEHFMRFSIQIVPEVACARGRVGEGKSLSRNLRAKRSRYPQKSERGLPGRGGLSNDGVRHCS